MKKGFTLLELLCVLLVLAVIVGVSVPSARGMRAESDLKKIQTDLAILQSAAEAYHFQYKTYPPEELYQEHLITDTGLFRQKLLDPLTKKEYIYSQFAGRYYYFLSPGQNREVDISRLDLQTGVLFQPAGSDDVLVTNLKVQNE